MKRFLFLSLLGLPVLFLWGCSLINNNDSWINTWDIEKISQLEQQLSWLLEQFSWLQNENESLKETLSWSLVSIQTLQSENERLQADVDKYNKMIVEDKLSTKNITIIQSSADQNKILNTNTTINTEKRQNTPGKIISIKENQNNSIEEKYEIEIDILTPNPNFSPGAWGTDWDYYINQSNKLRKFKISYAADVYKCNNDRRPELIYSLWYLISDLQNQTNNNQKPIWIFNSENGIIHSFYEPCLP